MTQPKDHFRDDTYALAKGLHHAEMAKQYFELVRINAKGNVKDLFNGFLMRLSYIISNVLHRVSEESRNLLKEELKDSLAIDVINDNLVHLSNEQRTVIEAITERMKNGEDIQMVE